MTRTTIIGVAVVVAATVASATPAIATTAPPPDDGYDRTGGNEASGPVTMTLGWAAGPDRPRGAVAARFAEEVAAATEGSVAIDVRFGLDEEYLDDYTNGDLDLVLTPAVSAPLLGVDTLDVLSLPFLVTDDEQADRVAQSDVAAELLAGFADDDSTGLVLAPTYAAHLSIAGDRPLRVLDQLHTGVREWPTAGRPLEAIFEAMGLSPRYDLSDVGWEEAVDDGTALTAVWPLQLSGVIPGPQMMAPDFTQYYDFAVIVGHNDALAELSDEQRAQLDAAAAATVQASVDDRLREDAAFRDACTTGANLRAASATFIADVSRAVDDTIIEMLTDPDTSALYDEVKRAAGAAQRPWPQECTDTVVSDYQPDPPESTEFVEGTYRTEGRTRDELYVSGLSADDAANNPAEYFEWTFADGTATLVRYRLDGSTVVEGEPAAPYSIDPAGYIVGEDGRRTSWHATDDGFFVEPVEPDYPTAWIDYVDIPIIVGRWVRVE